MKRRGRQSDRDGAPLIAVTPPSSTPESSVARRRPRTLRLIAAACAGASFLVAGEAHAIERQHHIGLGPALGILSIDGKSTLSVGAGAAVHYAYGLTDQWNLSIEGSSVIVAADQQQDFPTSPRNRPAGVDHAAVGIGYVIDILRWVPYINAHGGLYRLSGGTLDQALYLPGFSVGVGLDYQLNRRFAVGIAGREHLMLTKLDTYASYLTGIVRLEYMWGY